MATVRRFANQVEIFVAASWLANPGAATGKVRVKVHYIQVSPATS